MPIYAPGSDELVEQVQAAATRYHKDLVEAGLVVDVLEARPKCDDAGEPIDSALSLHGYPCTATIKINGPKDRGAGRGDCLLTVDAYRWPELSEAEQLAVLDHELTHLELVFNDHGNLKRDDYDRPKLRMRLHDVHHGWFREVAARHGLQSAECQQAAELADERNRMFYPGDPQERMAG
jgi:hypothetical protein